MARQTTTLALVLLAAALLSSCENQEAAVQEERTLAVNAMVITPSDQAVTRTFTGSVEGARQANLVAKIAETVTKVHVTEGSRVRAGYVLVSLDKSGPTSSYWQAETVFRNSEKQFKKMQHLYSEGAISETSFDAARVEFEVNKAAFEAAAQLVEMVSPIDGIVTSVDIAVGDNLFLGQQIATVATTERLRVRCNVNESDIGHLDQSTPIVVSAGGLDAQAPGRISSVSRSANPDTRAYEMEVEFENADGRFRPGMFVRVTARVEELADAIAVPHEAVVQLDETDQVFLIVNGRAELRPVTVGHDLGQFVEVSSGLNSGDTLVTLGQTYLSDGFSVRIASLETLAQ